MSHTVGFIGLGLMGKPMARNLLKKGFSVVAHSRSRGPVGELVKEGATAAGSPAEVARAAQYIVTMLPDGPDVELVLEGEHGVFNAMQKGTVIVDSSTIAPAIARRLAARAREMGCSMLDAPVSGGEIGAIDPVNIPTRRSKLTRSLEENRGCLSCCAWFAKRPSYPPGFRWATRDRL